MSQTANLILSYLAAGQAQKHVTVNESLRRLDAIVQLAVVSASVTAQPGSPADGAVWIVPSGKTGAQWSAFTNWALGYYRDGAWEQISPREGWLAWVKDDAEFVYFDGAAWEPLPGGGGGASAAGDVSFDPTGLSNLSATDVQAALEEVDALVGGGGGGYTDEQAQDAAAALFTPDDGDIDFTYNDATPSITAQIKAGAVDFTKLLNATQAAFIAATGAGAFSERTPAQARDLIGLDADDTVQFAGINLGHASDTTLTRSAAGVVAVEGVDLAGVSTTQTLTSKTLTTPTINGAALSGTLSGAHTLSGLATFSAGADMTPAATPSTTAVGYLGAPQRSISAADTFVMADAGKHLYHPAADTTARTWTIPANASVAFPIGTIITIVNENAAGVITLGITSDTLRWGSSTGSRSIAANGTATLVKVTATLWRLTGDGIT